MNRVIEMDRLDIAKEESMELQRLLNESYIRLEEEYKKRRYELVAIYMVFSGIYCIILIHNYKIIF